MSTRTDARLRGITVQRIDFSSLQEAIDKAVQDQGGKYDRGRISGTYAVARKGRKTYLIDDDGVGAEITEDDPLIVGIFPECDGSFSLMPTLSLTLTPDNIAKFPTQEIDLADHIRTFGDRLERNFDLWYRTLA